MLSFLVTRWVMIAADAVSTDPVTTFTGLGVAGAVAGAFALAWRKSEQRFDQQIELNRVLAEGLRELKPAVDRSTEVHQAATRAQEQMTQVMRDMPSKETWLRIAVALESQRKA